MTEKEKPKLELVRKADEVKPVLSMIIVARDGVENTARTINTFINSTIAPFEIIVMDNCTTDGTSDWLKSQKFLTHIRIDGKIPIPYGEAVNMGVEYAKGEYIGVCNNDLRFTPNWDDYIFMLFEQNKPEITGLEKIGVISPTTNSRIVPFVQLVDEKLMMEAGYNADVAAEFSKYIASYYNKQKDVSPYTLANCLSAFCWIMTWDCYKDVGGFETFEPYGNEDSEFVRKAIEKGYSCLVSKYSFVHHFGNEFNESMDQGFAMDGIAKKVEYYESIKNRIGEPKPKKCVFGYRVKNVSRWFKRVLEKASSLADEIVVFDDHSTDNTVKIAKEFGKVKVVNSPFGEKDFNEARDRDFLWHECQKLNPDWIIINDGDELWEDKFTRKELEKLMNPIDPSTYCYFFRYISLWDDESHQNQGKIFGNLGNVRMGRNIPNTHIVTDHPQGFHCGSLPPYPRASMKIVRFRLLHFGNMLEEERKRKYEWYQKMDTDKRRKDIGANDYRELLNTRVPITKFTPKINLSFMTIMKNEMQHPCHLIQFLDEYHLMFDEMILVDTGSDDNSIEIAKKYGARVLKYSWLGDFAAARNFGLKNVTGDWVLWADPDERLGHNAWKWLKLIEEPVLAYYVPILNILPPPNNPFPSGNYRLFRNVEGIHFSENNIIHEGISESLEKMKGAGNLESISIEGWIRKVEMFPGFVHYGYMRPGNIMKRKLIDYAKACSKILERDPENVYAHFSLALHESARGNDPRAKYHLEQALKYNSNHTQSRAKLVNLKAREIKEICEEGLNQEGTSSLHKLKLYKFLEIIAPIAQPESNLGLSARYSELDA